MKTDGGYSARVAGPGRFLWRTPHGQHVLVDHTGTTRLTPRQAEVMEDAPEGVEIYRTDTEVRYEPG